MRYLTRSRRNHPRAEMSLWVLFLGAFVVGTAELIVVGILNLIARDLAVPVSTAGTLVTGYAAGVCIGGPVLTAATIHLGRRLVLQLALAAYLAGTVLAVTAVSFGMLLMARILTGALHGLFIGVALAVASSLVPAHRLGRAISMVLGGIAVSTALGVPVGTLIGQQSGWRAAFAAIVAIGLVALIATLLLVTALGVLYLAGSIPVLAALALSLWGLVGFGLVPSLQYRVVSLAGPGDFAATLPASAVTAGIALGALAGGWAVSSQGASGAVLVGLAICAAALPASWATGFLKPQIIRGQPGPETRPDKELAVAVDSSSATAHDVENAGQASVVSRRRPRGNSKRH